jgi:hypothetical protein
MLTGSPPSRGLGPLFLDLPAAVANLPRRWFPGISLLLVCGATHGVISLLEVKKRVDAAGQLRRQVVALRAISAFADRREDASLTWSAWSSESSFADSRTRCMNWWAVHWKSSRGLFLV